MGGTGLAEDAFPPLASEAEGLRALVPVLPAPAAPVGVFGGEYVGADRLGGGGGACAACSCGAFS